MVTRLKKSDILIFTVFFSNKQGERKRVNTRSNVVQQPATSIALRETK